MRHVLAFSVSSIGAGLRSCQLAAFEVHHRQVGTKTASNQWHFRFQAILFDHTNPLQGFQDCAEAHADAHVEAKLAEIAFHRATVEGWLKLKDLCRSYCNVNFYDGGVCCTNCLTELNEMSIFQDFARSIDWVTLQQPRQIRQRLWFPQRLLIFDW